MYLLSQHKPIYLRKLRSIIEKGFRSWFHFVLSFPTASLLTCYCTDFSIDCSSLQHHQYHVNKAIDRRTIVIQNQSLFTQYTAIQNGRVSLRLCSSLSKASEEITIWLRLEKLESKIRNSSTRVTMEKWEVLYMDNFRLKHFHCVKQAIDFFFSFLVDALSIKMSVLLRIWNIFI